MRPYQPGADEDVSHRHVTYVFRKVSSLLREVGLRRTARAVLSRVGAAVYTRYDELVIVKDLAELEDARPPARLVVRPVEPRDAPALAAFCKEHRSLEAGRQVESFLRNGYGGFVGFVDGELVRAYWWVDRSHTPTQPQITRRGIALGEGDAYGFDYYVAPEARGHGVATEFVAEVERTLARSGYRTLSGGLSRSNLPARWLYSTRGYRFLRTIVSRRILGVLFITEAGVFVRNVPWSRTTPYDYRMIVPRGGSRRPAVQS